MGYFIVIYVFNIPEVVQLPPPPPSILCYVYNTTTVYPSDGTGYLTGPEYVIANNQGCVFDIKSAFIFIIHPKEKLKRILMKG